MSQAELSTEWDDYLAVLREDAHLLLAWGYADARRELPNARDEYDITGLLANAMDRRISDPATPERFMLYSVHNERPISPNAELGKDRPKLDIQIEHCGVRPKRHYTFEAKRLRDDNRASAADTLAHYLGDEGVGRFVVGRYESERVEAAMLGCIQAHDPAFWVRLLEGVFVDDVASGRNKFSLVENFRRCSVIPELADEASSSHKRANGSVIRLLHIFLSCS